jgi:hypothetical protein
MQELDQQLNITGACHENDRCIFGSYLFCRSDRCSMVHANLVQSGLASQTDAREAGPATGPKYIGEFWMRFNTSSVARTDLEAGF